MAKSVLAILAIVVPMAAAEVPCPSSAFVDVSQSPGPGGQYPDPRVEVRCEDDALIVSSNAIPHYEFVQITPNPLIALDRDYRMPRSPVLAEEPVPLPLLGPSGVAINGIPLFGPNEGPAPYPGYGDPVFNAILDDCLGHTARQYHYHALVEGCLERPRAAGEPSAVLAYAADGFAVFGPFGCVDEKCSEVVEFKSSWDEVGSPRHDTWDAYKFVPKEGPEFLDRCNGHSGDDQGGAYHYHATARFPYIMGCFAGTPSEYAGREDDRQGGRGGPGGGGPSEEPRPTREQVRIAAEKLRMDEQVLSEALRLTGGRVVPMNYAASARRLGIEHRALSDALGVEPARPPRPRRGRGPGRRGPGGPRGPRPGPRPR